MAKIDDMTLKVNMMGLDDLADLLETIRQRLDDHDTRAASLAQRLDTRLTAIEQRLAALEEPQGYLDDVRDALRALDELSATDPTRLPGLWKLHNFPPMNTEDGE